MTILDTVKTALRLTVEDYDTELLTLISAAQQDLGIAGVLLPSGLDSISTIAIVTYCKMRFGQPDDYDRLKRSYDEQKAQLMTATGYTDWGDGT